MKKFISILLLITSLTTILSLSVLAQEEQDTTEPTVKSIISLSSTELKVFFEGNVDKNVAEDKANYYIYGYSANTSYDILGANYNPEDNTVILETLPNFETGKIYKIDISNICSKTITLCFAGIGPKPEIAVKSVTAISNNKVKVCFNRDIYRFIVTDKSNYNIYNNEHIDITNIEYNSYDNAVIISTATDLKIGMLYKIDIKNICSDGNVTYVFAGTTAKPEVSVKSVIALSNTEFKVSFEGQLDIVQAENIANYYVENNSIEILTATYSSIDNSVTLKTNSLLNPGHVYKLLISNICTNGTVSYPFGIPGNEISVQAVISLKNTELKVYFDGTVDKNIVEDISNYNILDTSVNILNAQYSIKDNSVTLITTDGLQGGNIYFLEINNICSQDSVQIAFVGTEFN